jgi:hypothetical protein
MGRTGNGIGGQEEEGKNLPPAAPRKVRQQGRGEAARGGDETGAIGFGGGGAVWVERGAAGRSFYTGERPLLIPRGRCALRLASGLWVRRDCFL